jgi:hypothetical protein
VSNLTLQFDMDRVQSSVQAAIRPAIEEQLSSINIKKAIVEALERPPREDMLGMIYGRRHGTLLDQMIADAVRNVAKEYVTLRMLDNRPFIEDALSKMLTNSEARLTKMFAKAMTDAVEKADWSFDLDMKVEAKAGCGDE